MNISIKLATLHDVDEISNLYDKSVDYLESNINYPGWKKGIYPIREDAIKGINEKSLYVMLYNEVIIGSIILRHEPEKAYYQVKWQKELPYEDVFIIYTLVVHPDFQRQNIGVRLINFATSLAQVKGIKSIRLDVYEKNAPAIRLYEKCGFKYIDTVDLGLESYGLKWFKLYEMIIR